jgi:hypothetical protein
MLNLVCQFLSLVCYSVTLKNYSYINIESKKVDL